MNTQAERLLNEEPAHIGFVGTVDENGLPRTVPVWYRWDGEHIHITALRTSVWVNNLARDERACFCVAENGSPYRATMIQGRVWLEPEDGGEVQRIFARYMSLSEADRYYAAIKDRHRTMVRLVPEQVTFRPSSR